MFGTVDRPRHINVFVPHGISAKSRDVLGQRTVDQCGRGRRRSGAARNKWESPGRRAVPQILDRRIVIKSCSVGNRFAEEMAAVRKAHVGVVPTEMITLRVVRHLHKTAQVASPAPCKEKRHILRKLEVAILRSGLRRFGGGKRRIEDHGQGKRLQKLQGGVVALLFFAYRRFCGERVAFQFEFPAERRQLRRRIVAGRAG